MIDAFFRKFIALPELELSPESMQQFIRCARSIAEFYIQHEESKHPGIMPERFYSLSLANFHNFLKVNPDITFTLEELKKINIFIAATEDTVKEIRLFYKLINTSWQMMHPGTVPGGDDIHPLILCSIPHEVDLLEPLKEKLDFFYKIYDSSPFLFKLEMAHYILTEEYASKHIDDRGHLTEFQKDEYDKYWRVTNNLRDKDIVLKLVSKGSIFQDEKQLLKFEKMYLNICIKRMQDYINRIHFILGAYDINDFNIHNAVSNDPKTKRDKINSEVGRIQQLIDDDTFSLKKAGRNYTKNEEKKIKDDNLELKSCVKKYLCYMDIFLTLVKDANITENELERREQFSDSSENSGNVSENFLDRLNHDLFKAVNTATEKFKLYRNDLTDDLSAPLAVSPEFCEYLDIPTKTFNDFIRLFQAKTEKRQIALGVVIDRIANKLNNLDHVISRQRERLLSHHDLTKVAASRHT